MADLTINTQSPKGSDTDLLDYFEIVDILYIEANDMGNLSSAKPTLKLTKSPAEEGVGATLVRNTPASLRGPQATD
jgi:hypothetical protein